MVLRNVSARGVRGQCPAPPERGDYVEVRCGAHVIAARVAWARDGGTTPNALARPAANVSQALAAGEPR